MNLIHQCLKLDRNSIKDQIKTSLTTETIDSITNSSVNEIIAKYQQQDINLVGHKFIANKVWDYALPIHYRDYLSPSHNMLIAEKTKESLENFDVLVLLSLPEFKSKLEKLKKLRLINQ